jgi:hypothetical protein
LAALSIAPHPGQIHRDREQLAARVPSMRSIALHPDDIDGD